MMRDAIDAKAGVRNRLQASWLVVAPLLVFAVAGTRNANAQPAAGAQAPGRAALDCGARESKRTSCSADVSAGVVLVQQAGGTRCVLGQTWGFDAQGVWTANGCRGTFAVTDDRPKVSCAAPAGGRLECEAKTGDGVAILSGSPACVQGKTWGYDEAGVWVADGCSRRVCPRSRAGLTCASARRPRALRSGHIGRCCARQDDEHSVVRAGGELGCTTPRASGLTEAVVGSSYSGRPRLAAAQDRDPDAFFGTFEPYGRMLAHVGGLRRSARGAGQRVPGSACSFPRERRSSSSPPRSGA